MSILHIVIFSTAGITVGIYAFFTIKKAIKWKKTYKEYLKMGLSMLEAKELTNREVYPKKYARLHKTKQTDDNDTIFED